MKMEFCSKIKKLPVENLHKFVEKAMEIQKDSVAELENEKFQIRVDEWSRDIFDQMNLFVSELGTTKRQRTE